MNIVNIFNYILKYCSLILAALPESVSFLLMHNIPIYQNVRV